VASVGAGGGQDEVVGVVGEGDEVVDLVVLEFGSLDDVLDFEVEEVDQEDLVIQRDHYLVQPDLHLPYLRTEVHLRDYLLPLSITKTLLSSNIANRFGGVYGVYFYPTRAIRLLLLISSTNWSGVPKSRCLLRRKG